MYAIIRTGGHQEKVAAGERILIDRIKNAVGETITLHPLMISTDEGAVVSDPGELKSQNAAVIGTVLEHVKGDKIDVFQYRQKTGYRRHIGHRQALTAVEIAEIRLGDLSVKAEEAKAADVERREAEVKAREEQREAIRKARDEAAQKKKAATAAKKAAKASGAGAAAAAKKAAGPAKKAGAAKKSAGKKSTPKKKK
jgi:large subunit ribosomal protein L21